MPEIRKGTEVADGALMRHRLARRRLVALLAVALVTLVSDLARADREAPPQERATRSVVLGVHPLAPVAGRFGASIEWLFLPHHAITASLAYVRAEPACCTGRPQPAPLPGPRPPQGNRVSGLATELGYRYYPWSAGPRGVYLAPSLLLFRGSGIVDNDKPLPEITHLGGALDLGGQAILFDRLVLGAGVGIEATKAWPGVTTLGSEKSASPLYLLFSPGDRLIHSHVGPRLLATIGFAF